jgi:hypothetical protein
VLVLDAAGYSLQPDVLSIILDDNFTSLAAIPLFAWARELAFSMKLVR